MTNVAVNGNFSNKTSEVNTPDGVNICVQDWSRTDNTRSLLFVHGFSQSQYCWSKQTVAALLKDFRIVTYDNRGHGQSDKPEAPEYYRDPQRWADEVNAVIQQKKLDRPILVVWSYAGRIALDYLSKYGDSGLSGLVMVAATSSGEAKHHGPAIPLLAEMADADIAVATEAVRPFLECCTNSPLSDGEMQLLQASNNLTPPTVRRALMGRPADYDDILRALKIPVLAIHGAKDKVALPSMAKHTVAMAPQSKALIYPKIGHMPFWECPEKFNSDLANFARECP